VQRTRPDRHGEAAEMAEPHRAAETVAAPHHSVLALQRQIGNRAVAQMLVARQPAFGTTTPDQWATESRAGHNKALYAEIATLVGTGGLRDIKGTTEQEINGALRAQAADLKPGLNYVPMHGTHGSTGFLHDGTFDAKMPPTRTGDLPQVAIVLGNKAFEPDNKAFTVTIYRHELEHGIHNQMAIDWLKKWRDDPKAEKVPFELWLDKQTMSKTDRALVKEAARGATSSSESLAYAQGFVAGFGLERAGIELADRPITEELLKLADYWPHAAEPVQAETIARLKTYAAGLTDKERRATFRRTLEELKAKNSALAKLTDPILAAL
jgi:hypothetical protein